MLICFEFGFSLYRFGGCRQFRVSAYPLGRPADGQAVYIKPAGKFVYGDQQHVHDNIAEQGVSVQSQRV